MQKGLTYDDVLLVPQYSDIESRSEVSLTTDFGRGVELELPIIASPMDTVSEANMAGSLGELGGISIVHRYNSIEEQSAMIASLGENTLVGAAVGVSGDFADRAVSAVAAGAKVICIDIAHGHHILMKKAIKRIREVLPKIHIMAGNVATLEGFNDLADWGADSIRCNIGGGCFTPGTLVRGPNGDTPIEQIKIGDEVFSHTGEVRKVVDTLTFERDEELMIVNGIESTKNHEYYVVDMQDADKVNDDNLSNYAYWLEAERLDMNKHLLVELQ